MALKDQTTKIYIPFLKLYAHRIPWVPIPLVPEQIVVGDCSLVGLRVLNTTAAVLNFTYLDGAGNSYTQPVDPNQPPVGDDTQWGIPAPGGFSISASGAGLVFTAAWYLE